MLTTSVQPTTVVAGGCCGRGELPWEMLAIGALVFAVLPMLCLSVFLALIGASRTFIFTSISVGAMTLSWVMGDGSARTFFKLFVPLELLFWPCFAIAACVIAGRKTVDEPAVNGKKASALRTNPPMPSMLSGEKGHCPNCLSELPIEVPECNRCGALFSTGEGWRVIR